MPYSWTMGLQVQGFYFTTNLNSPEINSWSEANTLNAIIKTSHFICRRIQKKRVIFRFDKDSTFIHVKSKAKSFETFGATRNI